MGLDIDVLYMPYHPYILGHDHILLFLLLIMGMKNLDTAKANLEIKQNPIFYILILA